MSEPKPKSLDNEPADEEKALSYSSNSSEESRDGIVLQAHGKVSAFLLAQRNPKPIPNKRKPLPHATTNLLSFITFAWVGGLIRTGYTRMLDLNDIWTQNDDRKIEKFVAVFNKKRVEYKNNGSTSPHLKAIAYSLRWEFFKVCVAFGLYAAGEICMAVITRPTTAIITEVYLGNLGKRGHACAYAVGSFLEAFGFMLFFIWNQYYSRYYSETMRSVVIACIYEKVVLLSPHGRSQFPANKVTALVTADTNRLYMAARWTAALLEFLPIIGAMLGVLVDNIGVSALPGFGLIIIGLFVNVTLSRFIATYRRKSIPFADKRIASVRDTIENMRIIKYYGWEKSFVKLISDQRKQEASLLEKIGRVTGCIDAITTSVPLFAGMLSFAILSIVNGKLDPSRIFPSLTLFIIFIPMSMFFSTGLNTHADAWPSLMRIEAFFNADEDGHYVETSANPTDNAVNIVGGTFVWESNVPIPPQASFGHRVKRMMNSPFRKPQPAQASPVAEVPDGLQGSKLPANLSGTTDGKAFPGLVNVDLQIKRNELVMLVGSIGSGKSSLLSCIAGEMCKTGGNIYVDGKLTPVMANWSLNATIRDNILFGKEYNAEKYAEVTHVCSLESDFSAFDGRDFAEIGERGITLSGGQKARLSLARGVYNAGDIILLDDVLSAVDSKVGKQIFEKCIMGYLKNTTRIMATHNLKLLPMADKIVFLDGTGAIHHGTLDELLATNTFFKETYTNKTTHHDEDIEDGVDEIHEEADVAGDVHPLHKTPTLEPELIQRQLSRAPDNVKGLISKEGRKQGNISSKTVWAYAKMGSRIGAWFLIVVVLIQVVLGASSVMQSVWLNYWSADQFSQNNGWYIGFYALILAIRSISYAGLVFAVASFCFTSSSTLHNDALHNIYRAPMSYFDSTPLGRIISRFTDDIANLDSLLFMQMRMFLFSTSMLIGSLVVTFIYLPWAALALCPIIVGIYVFMSYFRCSSRELKRINSVCRSTMFTHVSETISGLSTILGYHRTTFFQKILHNSIDDLNITMNVLVSSQMWLSFRVVMCTLPISLLVSFLCVFRVFDISPSTVGLLLSLVPNIVISLALGVPMFTELENQMNSIERIHEFAHEIPQEAPYEIPETKPLESWPDSGHIVYRDANLRYRPNLPFALVNCTLEIPGGTKVGIVGRTGAGKSTMLSSLFRITELSSGSIHIDGIDISTIGLSDLRSKLSIIPQDPVLFQGTIRFNLDPFGQYTDVQLWDTLRRCGAIQGIEQVAPSHKFHLDAKVDSAGTNFSLGERQLLTLARALVRKPKVIVLDEATANVDLQTDMMVQRTIAREFVNCTIMCIAHRLQTILHYDVVVVMDQGKVLEQGPPMQLWQRSDGAFRSMCDEANLTAEEIERSVKYGVDL